MNVLFATAELAPVVKVGGLGDASAGLVKALRRIGVEVDVVMPDYGGLPFRQESESPLVVPDWVGWATARHGRLDGEPVTLIATPTSHRSHPYLDPGGSGWPDNDQRFFSFSAAVASLVTEDPPDIIHLNDWHSGLTLGFLPEPPPSVLTIHNLAYQGSADGGWLDVVPHHRPSYELNGAVNPLAGAIAVADRVITVSPTYARETLQPENGCGVSHLLTAKGPGYVGILNGIDTEVWNPSTDPHLPLRYGPDSVELKREIRRDLAREVGLEPDEGPLVGMVTRLTHQKGVDLALAAAARLGELGAHMVLLGSGERHLAEESEIAASDSRGRLAFRSGYDEGLSHRIFAGSDLYLMPSRFEPGGLTQMQAMRYGAIPVVTDVGGLHDTVIDADLDPDSGNGFVAADVDAVSVSDALERAVRVWRSTRRRGVIRARGMHRDWSWERPAGEYLAVYEELRRGR